MSEWTEGKIEELEAKVEGLQKEIKERYEKLKRPRLSCGSDFWTDCADAVAAQEQYANISSELARGKAIICGDESSWDESPERQNLLSQIAALEKKAKVIRRHASNLSERLETENGALNKSFIELLMKAPVATNLHPYQFDGQRNRDTHKAFRRGIITTYNLSPTKEEIENKNLRTNELDLWDVSGGGFMPEEMFAAAHIYPYKTGQSIMTAIFGSDAVNELSSPHNGLLISKRLGKLIDIGIIVIVPDLPLKATQEQFNQWQTSDPKEYVFRILDRAYFKGQEIKATVHKHYKEKLEEKIYLGRSKNVTLRELDGRRLPWRSPFRPRARYLYYLYCYNILRYVWNNRDEPHFLPGEFGQPYWGSPGKYIKESMIKCLVQEIGHEIVSFLEDDAEDKGKEKEEIEKAENVLLTAALTEDVVRKVDISTGIKPIKALECLNEEPDTYGKEYNGGREEEEDEDCYVDWFDDDYD